MLYIYYNTVTVLYFGYRNLIFNKLSDFSKSIIIKKLSIKMCDVRAKPLADEDF